jgi:hypothetical protein
VVGEDAEAKKTRFRDGFRLLGLINA